MKVSRRCESGGARVDLEQFGALVDDHFLGEIAARPAFELATERAIGAVRARATALGRLPKLILANRVAATNDHGDRFIR